MDSGSTSPYSHSIVDSGVDWITATHPCGDGGYKLEQLGTSLIDDQREAGKEVKRAVLRDYTGWRGEHLFVGMREQDVLIAASQEVSARHWADITRAARNVSRLDVQASVWTHGEQPSLARWSYSKLKRSPAKRGRPRSYSLIRTHPYGETLNLGKRQSDSYGRLYDWGTAHKAATPQTVWRYEVEYKRALALGCARTLLLADDPRTESANLVHGWFSKRGVQPTWSTTDSRLSNGAALNVPVRNVLTWFETSLSKTIRRAIDLHGLDRVLLALGLSDMVQPKRRR